ncbi:MAG TPA: methyltransferase [Acidimicrobiales bacterium]
MTTTTPPAGRTAPPAGPAGTRAALVPLLFGFFPTQVLHVAATLGVVDHLAAGPRTTRQLADATGAHEPSLARVLRALACFGVLDEIEPGTFGPGPHAGGLAADGPASLRHLVRLFAGPEVWRSWGELDEVVRTGEPAWPRVTGMSPFEHMAHDPAYRAMFDRAMSEGTRSAAPGILQAADLGRFSWLVDVGGGDGTLLAAALAAHPGLRGTVFDTAEGVQAAPPVLAAHGVAGRGEVAAGDFFASVPAGADAYLLKSVVHDWDDERARAILATVRSAMPDGARMLVVEPVLPPTPSGSPDVLMMVMSDLNMLVCTGGRERTEDEFRTLLAGAGLALRSVTPAPGPTNYSVLEAEAAG